jgi:acyl-CoA dehydrogenase
MDFTLPPRDEDFRARIAALCQDHILPVEGDRTTGTPTATSPTARWTACAPRPGPKGLWCLQLSPENGGQGLSRVGMAACYEEMNRSIFGPVVFNSAAPDDGNMMVLERAGTPDQRARWLAPIVAGTCGRPSP